MSTASPASVMPTSSGSAYRWSTQSADPRYCQGSAATSSSRNDWAASVSGAKLTTEPWFVTEKSGMCHRQSVRVETLHGAAVRDVSRNDSSVGCGAFGLVGALGGVLRRVGFWPVPAHHKGHSSTCL